MTGKNFMFLKLLISGEMGHNKFSVIFRKKVSAKLPGMQTTAGQDGSTSWITQHQEQWFGGHCGDGLMVGLDDLNVFFNLNDSVVLSLPVLL